MLQKLSKCEVKAVLCGNLPLRFYVKLNFCEFKWSKNVIFENLVILHFNFSFEPFLKS